MLVTILFVFKTYKKVRVTDLCNVYMCSKEKGQTPGIQRASQNFVSTFPLTWALTFKHTFVPVLLHYTIKTVVLKTQCLI